MNKINKVRKVFSLSFMLVLMMFISCTVSKTAQKQGRSNLLENGLASFSTPYGDWVIEDGQLILPVKNEKRRTDIWLNGDYGDFRLELDFKVDKGTNSGVFIRTSDIKDPVQSGIEVQVRDDYGKSPIDKHFCGSVYEIKEVSENRVKKVGEWNHMEIICLGAKINVLLNGGEVVDINLNDWKDVGRNPNGTENKFKTAYKDMAQKGKIGFQDHGGVVWYKNVRIKPL